MKEISVDNSFRLIEPGPILLVSTCAAGEPNVMTMGFHMMVRHAPPLIGCVIGPWDHSYAALRDTGQCVLSVPRSNMSAVVTDIGNCSGGDIDKFETFGLATLPGNAGAAPLLADCIANLECRLVDGTLSDRYSLHVLEVERLWVASDWREAAMLHHIGDGRYRSDGELLDENRRMTRWRHLASLGI
ncbi:flavin reductase family protein [Agrobacterium vitis]|uniref:flavin reductase family protein n=1 Tax=Agrobacterium vitis TaxID=373 RepID=UPI0012E816CA|nr:flavin reductase family protein [Agrobacterium vitis]MVA37551.1 flavin reductase family protein [Agrobacterium vitis]